ncbi:MAG: uroporphyrinogen decarboxylase family protein [Clostridia bacterium]
MNMRQRREMIEQGQIPDRFPVHCIHPWRETLIRWEKEGKPPQMNHNQLLGTDQDMDTEMLPFNIGMAPQYDVLELRRDAKNVIVRDEFGVTRRMPINDFEITKGLMMLTGETSCMSEFIEYPLTDEESWENLKAYHFSDLLCARVPKDWEHRVEYYREIAKEKYIGLRGYPIMGAIGGLRQMMGLENLIFTMADNPNFIRRVWTELIELWKSLLQKALNMVPIDHIIFFEDLCGTHGPLFSPAMFMDFFADGYRELLTFLKEHGVHALDFDTDGNAMLMLDAIEDIGFTMFSPVQASAGTDPEEVLKRHPKLMLHGGINHHVLSFGTKDEIEEEVRKKYATAWKYGRYIPAPEHSIPPTVSWDHIRYYADFSLRYSVMAP